MKTELSLAAGVVSAVVTGVSLTVDWPTQVAYPAPGEAMTTPGLALPPSPKALDERIEVLEDELASLRAKRAALEARGPCDLKWHMFPRP